MTIQALCFKEDYRTFKKGDMIPFFDGVTLLVGDQGCGKSSILQCLAALGGCKRPFWKRDRTEELKKVAMLLVDKPAPVFAHDFENDSPRTAPSLDTIGTIPFHMAHAQMRMSHGQASNTLTSLIAKMKDTYIILDEPDSGMSCCSALALAKAFKNAVANGCQVIASVHHPWLIEAFDRVYSVEHKDFMKSAEFLASMREPRQTPELFEGK